MPLHPFLVHFPVALYTTSVVLDFIGVLRKNGTFESAAWKTQLASVAGFLFAVVSGLLEKGTVSANAHSEAIAAVATHEELAFVTTALVAALSLWRAGQRGVLRREWSRRYLAASLLTLLCLWYTAWAGGVLVFEHGIGMHLR